jgi:hypothetical protein
MPGKTNNIDEKLAEFNANRDSYEKQGRIIAIRAVGRDLDFDEIIYPTVPRRIAMFPMSAFAAPGGSYKYAVRVDKRPDCGTDELLKDTWKFVSDRTDSGALRGELSVAFNDGLNASVLLVEKKMFGAILSPSIKRIPSILPPFVKNKQVIDKYASRPPFLNMFFTVGVGRLGEELLGEAARTLESAGMVLRGKYESSIADARRPSG